MDDMENSISLNYVLDSLGSRLERTNKRLFILSIILTIILFVSNGLWIIYECQYTHEVCIEQEVDTGDGDAFVNGVGDFNYGEGETKNN